jgi:hypothetical protein
MKRLFIFLIFCATLLPFTVPSRFPTVRARQQIIACVEDALRDD